MVEVALVDLVPETKSSKIKDLMVKYKEMKCLRTHRARLTIYTIYRTFVQDYPMKPVQNNTRFTNATMFKKMSSLSP
jgi:hypothetical protein